MAWPRLHQDRDFIWGDQDDCKTKAKDITKCPRGASRARPVLKDNIASRNEHYCYWLGSQVREKTERALCKQQRTGRPHGRHRRFKTTRVGIERYLPTVQINQRSNGPVRLDAFRHVKKHKCDYQQWEKPLQSARRDAWNDGRFYDNALKY